MSCDPQWTAVSADIWFLQRPLEFPLAMAYRHNGAASDYGKKKWAAWIVGRDGFALLATSREGAQRIAEKALGVVTEGEET